MAHARLRFHRGGPEVAIARRVVKTLAGRYGDKVARPVPCHFLLRHHDRYRIDNLPAALFVAINSLHYTVAHYFSLERPALARAEVIRALGDMLGAYLEAGAQKQPPKQKAVRRRPSATKRRRV